MKVAELFIAEKQLVARNDFDRSGTAMKIPNQYVNTNWGKPKKATAQTITVRSSGKDHKVYGYRTIMQK